MTKIWCQDFRESVYTDAALKDAKSFVGIPLSSGRRLAERFLSTPAVELRSGESFADFAMAGPMFLVSSKLKSVLEHNGANSEFFEVNTDTGDTMFYCNFLETIDCFDRTASSFTPENGFATQIERIVLKTPENEPSIYRVAMTIPVIIAVREDLAIAMVSSGITGVLLKTTQEWRNPTSPQNDDR